MSKILNNFYVYILHCKNNSYYTGYTTDLKRRYQAHCDGSASKYTRSFKPIGIAQHWEFKSKSTAMKAESLIKKLNRRKKEELIANPSFLLLNDIETNEF